MHQIILKVCSMNKNSFINLDSLDLYKTFRVNGSRSAIELVSSLNLFMITARFVTITELVALNIISRFEWYRNELSKADADGTEEIIRHIETAITKIGAQRYHEPMFNDSGYKYHREKRLKRGETKSLEILDEIFSVNANEGGKPVYAPANTNIPTPVNTNTPTQKKTKSTIEDSGLLKCLKHKREYVGLDCHTYVLNRFMTACKGIPLCFKFRAKVINKLDEIKLNALKSGAKDAEAFAKDIQDIQQKLRLFNGTNLDGEFRNYEKTALSNFKYRLRMADTHDDLNTLIYEFEVFRWAYASPENTFEYGELHRQMKSKLESHEESAVSCQESQSDILTYRQAQG